MNQEYFDKAQYKLRIKSMICRLVLFVKSLAFIFVLLATCYLLLATSTHAALDTSYYGEDSYSSYGSAPADSSFSAPQNSSPPPDWTFGSPSQNNGYQTFGTPPNNNYQSFGTPPNNNYQSFGTPPSQGSGRGARITNPLAGIADSIPQLINYILKIVRDLAYFVALGMIIYGAYQILTAVGDAKKFQSGKNTIMYAVIGFALILLSDVIVDVIREIVTGT